ncbi:MAG: hypothetical protein FIA95_08990 [Gemmatimonadetes bacterium]|nr:hypothetical protein [Gemmatimonadota bacterium]
MALPLGPTLARAALACALLAAASCAGGAGTRELSLPPRPAGAPGGSEIARQVRSLDLEAREERICAEIARGNVPDRLRRLRPVEVTRELDGRTHRATFWVAPDYLAVGSDEDPFLVPLTPQTAQRIADLVGASLPTPLVVDAVWEAARVRLEPQPIPPSPEMTTVAVFEDHNRLVREQLAGRRVKAGSLKAGALLAGHKKDVVITAALASSPGKVAIYGWHRLDGRPIQPVYLGHTDRWVDYSHGIRLVLREVIVDGVPHDVADILRAPRLAGLFSGEGVIERPRYETPVPGR